MPRRPARVVTGSEVGVDGMKSRVPFLLLFCGVGILIYSIVVLGIVAAAPDLRIDAPALRRSLAQWGRRRRRDAGGSAREAPMVPVLRLEINLPAGGTVVFSVTADRRGFDGPIHLTVADLPKGIHVDGGTISRQYMDAYNARTFNRRGILTLTADPGVPLPTGQLQIWGEGKLADGTVLRRRARGIGRQSTSLEQRNRASWIASVR